MAKSTSQVGARWIARERGLTEDPTKRKRRCKYNPWIPDAVSVVSSWHPNEEAPDEEIKERP